jgi:superfamily II DNA or RNA helicase
MDQWEDRIRTFVPGASVGRLQRDVEDVEDREIVVGMLQSLAMRDYDDDIFDDFGLVIFDEVHVVPAPVFSRALLKLCTPKVLGLSATPVRRDGLSFVIHWFIGPIFFEHSLAGKNEVTVSVLKFWINRTPKLVQMAKYNMAAVITMLCDIEERNALIVSKVAELVSLGHKVLLLSDRRAHCESLRTMLKKHQIEGALYLGGMKGYELERSTTMKAMFATYSMAKEGLDIPSLDALVLATPRSDVVQACGRILHGKTLLSPVIVDVVDQWFMGRAQHNKRQAYYLSSGFKLK